MKKRILFLFLTVGMLAVGCGNIEVDNVLDFFSKEDVEDSDDIENSDDLKTNKVKSDDEITETPEKNSTREENAEEAEMESDVPKESSAEILSFSAFQDLEFYFSSGAGGWRTVMQIEEDGSFRGEYSDSEMGSTGEGYPNGTLYFCSFEGKFSEPVKVNDYTYSMQIEEIGYEDKVDTEEIIDGILYCYSDAYGVIGAEEMLIFMPGAPTAELPEEYMSWVRNDMEDSDAQELPFYGLYNVKEQNGFSSYDISGRIDDMMAATEEWSLTIKASLENDPLTQAEMNTKSKELYDVWNNALNTLWAELKNTLPEEEFEVLMEEQRAWISAKEKAVEEAGKEYEGGSIYSLVVNSEAAEWTEMRVYELYEILKK